MPLVTPYTLAVLVPALLVVPLVVNYLRNPLRKVPAAHPLTHFSALWIHYVRWRRIENATLKAAHGRLGPVVCLGPGEISVNCVQGGIREVYGGGFEKGNGRYNWYGFFANYGGVHNMFSTETNKPHSQRKRMLSNVYSKSFVTTNQALLAQITLILYDRFLPCLEATFSTSNPGVLDIYTLLNGATMDIVTAYIFGLKAGSKLIENPRQLAWFLDLYNSRRSFTFWPQELPEFTAFVEKWLGFRLAPKWVDEANAEIEEWAAKMCEDAGTVVEDGVARPEDLPVVYQQLSNALFKDMGKEGNLGKEVLASEVLDHLAAGFDTSGITLVYAVHELSKNKEIQDCLRKELLTLSPQLVPSSSPTLPDPKAVDALPLLHAVLWETLRLHPAIPGPQPRFTPAPGCQLGPENASYFVPGGVRVSASAGLLHQNEKVYERANEWEPRRWTHLEALDVEKRRDLESRWFWAFGSGGRMCVGRHLAIYQMKYIIAALYSNYSTHIIDDTDIEQSDAYTAPPKSEKITVGLNRLRKSS